MVKYFPCWSIGFRWTEVFAQASSVLKIYRVAHSPVVVASMRLEQTWISCGHGERTMAATWQLLVVVQTRFDFHLVHGWFENKLYQVSVAARLVEILFVEISWLAAEIFRLSHYADRGKSARLNLCHGIFHGREEFLCRIVPSLGKGRYSNHYSFEHFEHGLRTFQNRSIGFLDLKLTSTGYLENWLLWMPVRYSAVPVPP